MKSRITATLTAKVECDLLAYVKAASAAGVGVLAMAQPSGAKIIYTPTHVVIGPTPSTYQLDLNRDAITDFTISNSFGCDISGCYYSLGVLQKQDGNGVEFKKGRYSSSAGALRRGAAIGPKKSFRTCCPAEMADVYYSTYGNQRTVRGEWVNVSKRYLGLKFQINGETHYGWARLNVSVHGADITATLTGYAYETIPNRPIIAGNRGSTAGMTSLHGTHEPAGLGRLALGASGGQPRAVR